MADFRSSFRTVLMAGACLMATPALAQQTPTQDEASRLDDIVVTASTRQQSVVEAPASITVVTSETLENRAVATLFDAVQDVEGVSVSGGSNFQDIYIRGLPGAYTLILVDGRRQSTRDARINGNGGFEQSFVPPVGAIERIEVVRGPMSSLYGSDAIGGVINIITKKVPQRWGGSIGADYISQSHDETGDWSQIQAFVGGPLVADTLGLQLWGRVYERQEDAILNGVNASKDHNLAGRLAWVPNPDHKVLFQADTTRVRRESSAGRNLAANGADTFTLNDRDSYSVAWNGNWSWGTSAVSVLREEAQRQQFTRNNTTHAFVRAVRAPEIVNTVIDAVVNTPLQGTALGDHNLVFGGQYVRNQLMDINPGVNATLQQRFEIWQRALFLEDEWRLSDRFALTGGLRFDDHERYGGHWSPRLYGVFNATDSLTLKGGVSTGFRAPELRQVAEGYAYTTGGATCTVGPTGTCGVIIGDPDIKPESSINYELSALYNPSRDLSLTATVFQTDFEDKIDSARVCGPDANNNGACDLNEVVRWAENPNYQLYYWYNLADARIRGVEVSGTWRPVADLKLKAGYTYTDSEQRSGAYAGQPLARTPKHMANMRADYDLTDRVSLWGAAAYHGEEVNAGLRVGTNGTPIFDGSVQVGRLYPSYTLVDAGVTFRATDRVTLRAAVYNIGDERLNVLDYDFQGDGRRAWLGVNLTF